MWPQSTQRSTWPPSVAAAVLNPDITLSCARLTCPALVLRQAAPWRWKMSATSSRERPTAAGLHRGSCLHWGQRREPVERAGHSTDRPIGDAGVKGRGRAWHGRAAAQRAGRGASAGSGLAAGRDCAGAVWRGAGLGARPGHWSRTNVMPGHDEPLLSIVTVTFPGMIRGEPAMGAEHRAYSLVFGGLVQTRTMMQPCASTARFRGGGPIL